jgi:hypothetical protein
MRKTCVSGVEYGKVAGNKVIWEEGEGLRLYDIVGHGKELYSNLSAMGRHWVKLLVCFIF